MNEYILDIKPSKINQELIQQFLIDKFPMLELKKGSKSWRIVKQEFYGGLRLGWYDDHEIHTEKYGCGFWSWVEYELQIWLSSRFKVETEFRNHGTHDSYFSYFRAEYADHIRLDAMTQIEKDWFDAADYPADITPILGWENWTDIELKWEMPDLDIENFFLE